MERESEREREIERCSRSEGLGSGEVFGMAQSILHGLRSSPTDAVGG